MKCIRCNKSNTTKIDRDATFIYCLDCNFTFRANLEVKTGTVEFPASKFVDNIKNMELVSPQERAILEAGLTGEFMEQWFEGFKAGQMASIVHARKHYDGKNRDNNSTPDGSTTSGDESTGGTDGSQPVGETSIDRSATTSDTDTAGRVTETIMGIPVSLPTHVNTLTLRAALAEMIDNTDYTIKTINIT